MAGGQQDEESENGGVREGGRLTSSWRLVAHTVLAGPALEPEGLAAAGLLALPHAARVEGAHVLGGVIQCPGLAWQTWR